MLKKTIFILYFSYSWTLFSQNFIYKPVEICFDNIIVEKSNFNFKDDSTFNTVPDYLKDYAPGSFIQEFGSWEKFPSNYKMFDSISSENFKDNWTKNRNKIIELSKTKNLDYISLTKCLEIIKKDNKEIVLLPIAAYQCKNRDHDVWIIICLWENKKVLKAISKTEYTVYGHIREFAIDITDFKIITYRTCG